jgi:hypothetical protein
MWLLLLAMSCSLAAPEATIPMAHVRPVSASVNTLLTEATTRSSIVNQLVERLTGTDVIVYVELVASPEIPLARTKLVSGSPGARFLRISINGRNPPWDRVALLAHELQHAVEIATAADVRDDEGVRRLYARIGFPGGTDRFETVAARRIEMLAREELAQRR